MELYKKIIIGIVILILIIGIGITIFDYIKCGKNFPCNPFKPHADKTPSSVSNMQTNYIKETDDYIISWTAPSNMGNGNPANFFYEYFVWKGNNPSYTSTTLNPDQSNKTTDTKFILSKALNNSPQITVIVTSNNEFGASPDTLKVFTLIQSPVISNVSFDMSSFQNNLMTKTPKVNIELQGNLGGSVSVSSTIAFTPYGSKTAVTIPRLSCTGVTDNKASCLFGLNDNNLYGGSVYTANGYVTNAVGTGMKTSQFFSQPEIVPSTIQNLIINANPFVDGNVIKLQNVNNNLLLSYCHGCYNKGNVIVDPQDSVFINKGTNDNLTWSTWMVKDFGNGTIGLINQSNGQFLKPFKQGNYVAATDVYSANWSPHIVSQDKSGNWIIKNVDINKYLALNPTNNSAYYADTQADNKSLFKVI